MSLPDFFFHIQLSHYHMWQEIEPHETWQWSSNLKSTWFLNATCTVMLFTHVAVLSFRAKCLCGHSFAQCKYSFTCGLTRKDKWMELGIFIGSIVRCYASIRPDSWLMERSSVSHIFPGVMVFVSPGPLLLRWSCCPVEPSDSQNINRSISPICRSTTRVNRHSRSPRPRSQTTDENHSRPDKSCSASSARSACACNRLQSRGTRGTGLPSCSESAGLFSLSL